MYLLLSTVISISRTARTGQQHIKSDRETECSENNETGVTTWRPSYRLRFIPLNSPSDPMVSDLPRPCISLGQPEPVLPYQLFQDTLYYFPNASQTLKRKHPVRLNLLPLPTWCIVQTQYGAY